MYCKGQRSNRNNCKAPDILNFQIILFLHQFIIILKTKSFTVVFQNGYSLKINKILEQTLWERPISIKLQVYGLKFTKISLCIECADGTKIDFFRTAFQ